MHLQNGTENALERGVLKKTTKNYARRAISILKHPFARVRKGAFEKNYEKLHAKGHFDFTSLSAHARKGLLLSG